MKIQFKLKLILFLMLFVLLLSYGCKTFKLHMTLKPPQRIQPSETFMAGAHKIDITPPPGYPMGGYAIAGKFSRGWWTRLLARAIYLEDTQGQRLVLVSTDLWSVPAGLADRVVEIIQTEYPHIKIGREQLLIAATHTHNSPGNYSSAKTYNLVASPGVGFDIKLFEFLGNRIAMAIANAEKKKKCANLFQEKILVKGLSRNRSIDAFNSNPEKDEIKNLSGVDENTASNWFKDNLPHCVLSHEVFQAINPTMNLIKISPISSDSEKHAPIAIAVFFAAHPTAMGPTTMVYSSDTFGVACTLVEQHLNNNNYDCKSVVAFFNGPQGDINSNWKKQDRRNTLRIGSELAEHILTGNASASHKIAGELTYRFRTVKIKDRFIDDFTNTNVMENLPLLPEVKTGKRAFPGVGVLGGSENGRGFLYNFGFREGIKSNTFDPRHGYKIFAVTRFLDRYLRLNKNNIFLDLIKKYFKKYLTKGFPQELPLGIYTVGSIAIGTIPGEATVTLGHRITESLKSVLNPDQDIILVGLANEYLSYFTTPEEYNAQHYEGASTMYGQFSGAYLKQELKKLAVAVENTAQYNFERTYIPGDKTHGLTMFDMEKIINIEEDLANILQDNSTGQRLLTSPQFSWFDRFITLNSWKDIETQLVNPEVTVQVLTDTGWTCLATSFEGVAGNSQAITVPEINTTSLNLVTFIKYVKRNVAHWQVIWLVPENVDKEQTYRFYVKKPDGEVKTSESFRLSK